MAGLVEKALALAHQRRSLPERVWNRAGSLLDRSASPLALTPVQEPTFSAVECLAALGIGCQPLVARVPADLEQDVQQRVRALGTNAPFSCLHNGTTTFARLCYVVCRGHRPTNVVETGVAYGVTSSYVLRALADVTAGKLHSIDLPPLARDAEAYVGYCVPDNLRQDWDLRLGSARKLLPGILREHPPDVFIHDSLHTYSHMKWEFALALSAIRPGGVLIADDIEGNRAFEEALQHPRAGAWIAIKQEGKKAICGAIRIKQ